jgi:hypothetical protein
MRNLLSLSIFAHLDAKSKALQLIFNVLDETHIRLDEMSIISDHTLPVVKELGGQRNEFQIPVRICCFWSLPSKPCCTFPE